MRVAFVKRRYHPTGGGERYLAALLEALHARGWELSLVGERCDPALGRRLLLTDGSPVVRRAAATLLLRIPAADGRVDRVALRRCAEQDVDGSVAARCGGAPPAFPRQHDPVAVYVVPAAEAEPVARAPFALVLADGLMRLGVSDRRGLVFEAEAPRGPVSLEVPAPLER